MSVRLIDELAKASIRKVYWRFGGRHRYPLIAATCSEAANSLLRPYVARSLDREPIHRPMGAANPVPPSRPAARRVVTPVARQSTRRNHPIIRPHGPLRAACRNVRCPIAKRSSACLAASRFGRETPGALKSARRTSIQVDGSGRRPTREANAISNVPNLATEAPACPAR